VEPDPQQTQKTVAIQEDLLKVAKLEVVMKTKVLHQSEMVIHVLIQQEELVKNHLILKPIFL
jgi:hypothetical protein